MAEVALAHGISITVEAAYRCGDMIAKWCKVMEDWAQFLTGAGCDPASDRDANAPD